MNHLPCPPFNLDEDYIREIRAGGQRAETAIHCLYMRYRKTTYSYLDRLVSRHPAIRGIADDIMHDAFIILVDKIRQGQCEVKSLGGFWIGIGKMIFLNQLKKDERVILVHDMEEQYIAAEEMPESYSLSSPDHERLEAAFYQLEARCRQILLLWIDRYSMVEIARVMNLSSDAMARKIKFHCFRKLKDLLKPGNITTG